MILETGKAYDTATLRCVGWTKRDDSTFLSNENCWKYFDGAGVYRGPNDQGEEPLFEVIDNDFLFNLSVVELGTLALEALELLLNRLRLMPGVTFFDHNYLGRVAGTLREGSFEFWFADLDFYLPLSDLSRWLVNPVPASAAACGVSVEDFKRWMEYVEPEYINVRMGSELPWASVECCRRGCRNTKNIYFSDPQQMLAAEDRAARETWFCHVHRLEEWETVGVLSDDLTAILLEVESKPGMNKTEITQLGNAKCREFLEEIEAVQIEKTMMPNRTTLKWSYFLSEIGVAYLDRVRSVGLIPTPPLPVIDAHRSNFKVVRLKAK